MGKEFGLIVNSRAVLMTVAGLGLCASLLTSAAIAAPPKKKTTKKTTAKPASSAALIAAGKKVYAANGCKNCHAIAGEGGKGGPDLTKVGAEASHTPKWLEVQVVNPKAHNDSSTMPSYEESIKGKDLTALVAYLSSLKK